ncbi:MAG TPA: hypothetical protein VJ438_02045 [Candidatus Nanoarchaeia archaeon]|nr:hypothetical protein [Candidatus Nanoarchaeia archaeon]
MTKNVLLDTSFILMAIRSNIDFIEEIKFLGLTMLVPTQVIDEIKGIVKSKKKLKFRDEAALALRIVDIPSLSKVHLKSKNVDNGIVLFAKENKDVIVATMDKELKSRIKNQKLIVRAGKKLEIL